MSFCCTTFQDVTLYILIEGVPFFLEEFGSLAGGMSVEEVAEEYGISKDDVLAAIEYAAKTIAKEEIREYAKT